MKRRKIQRIRKTPCILKLNGTHRKCKRRTSRMSCENSRKLEQHKMENRRKRDKTVRRPIPEVQCQTNKRSEKEKEEKRMKKSSKN